MKHLRFLLFVLLFILFFSTPKFAQASAGSCDNWPNICNQHSATADNPNDPIPETDCVVDGTTTYYDSAQNTTVNKHYVFSSQSDHCGPLGLDWLPHPPTCVPRCGFLNSGFCCRPKTASDNVQKPNAFIQAPPCGNDPLKDKKCNWVQTAFGRINTDPAGLVQSIFTILLGFSGGVALLLIIASGYQLMTSQGNPEKVKEGRERLTAAIVGLLFIIFSTLILQIIGVDILNLPGFTR